MENELDYYHRRIQELQHVASSESTITRIQQMIKIVDQIHQINALQVDLQYSQKEYNEVYSKFNLVL